MKKGADYAGQTSTSCYNRTFWTNTQVALLNLFFYSTVSYSHKADVILTRHGCMGSKGDVYVPMTSFFLDS